MTLAEKFSRFAVRQYKWYLTPVKYNFMESLSNGDLDDVRKTVALFPEAVHWQGGQSMSGTWDGTTPLQAAYYARNCSGGNVGMMDFLIDHGADVNRQGAGGYTVLHRAAGHVDKEAIAALILRGADPDLKNDKGESPRHFLARAQDKDKAAECLRAIDESLAAYAKLCADATIASCTGGTQRAVPVRNRPLKLKKSKITY